MQSTAPSPFSAVDSLRQRSVVRRSSLFRRRRRTLHQSSFRSISNRGLYLAPRRPLTSSRVGRNSPPLVVARVLQRAVTLGYTVIVHIPTLRSKAICKPENMPSWWSIRITANCAIFPFFVYTKPTSASVAFRATSSISHGLRLVGVWPLLPKFHKLVTRP